MASYRIYVLIPNDMPSMICNRGKVAAQVHHAGTQIFEHVDKPDVKNYIKQGYENGAKGFNTSIVLTGPSENINKFIDFAAKNGLTWDTVIDPTYPFYIDSDLADVLNTQVNKTDTVTNDGKVLCTVRKQTVTWVLVDTDIWETVPEFTELFNGMKLYS